MRGSEAAVLLVLVHSLLREALLLQPCPSVWSLSRERVFLQDDVPESRLSAAVATRPCTHYCCTTRPPQHVLQVAKHLGDVQHALPLRIVCKEWRDTATLSSVEADVDLPPGDNPVPSNAVEATKEELFFRRCPRLRKLTYHVSPAILLAHVGTSILELSSCACWYHAGRKDTVVPVQPLTYPLLLY